MDLKALSKRAYSYFGGLSKKEVQELVSHALLLKGEGVTLNNEVVKLKEEAEVLVQKNKAYELLFEDTRANQERIIQRENFLASQVDELQKEKKNLLDQIARDTKQMQDYNEGLLKSNEKIASLAKQIIEEVAFTETLKEG